MARLNCEACVCSRRFVIIQNGKPRIIDDLKESSVNAAYTAVDKLSLHDIDFLSSLAFLIAQTSHDAEGCVSMVLESGEVLEGRKHHDFVSHTEWSVRCLDLAKAYKQNPVSSEARPFGVLVLREPASGNARFVITRSLPFGACASVFAFNRISRALWFLAVKLCGIIGGCFYDDYPLFEPSITAPLASSSVEHLLDCLGWVYSNDPAKSRPFEPECDILGVRVDVSRLALGCLKLTNKPSRYTRLLELLAKARKKGCFHKRDAQVIHGMLNFMTSFVMGHSLKLACRVFANLSSRPVEMTCSQTEALCSWTEDLLEKLQPRILNCEGDPSPVLIFTDAAYEDGHATWGIVVGDTLTGTFEVSGGHIPAALIDQWKFVVGEQVITQAEAFAAALARRAYETLVTQRRVILFVDNDAARFSLIKGSSPSVALLKIAQCFHSCGNRDHAIFWIERVPTASNIADLPSRGKLDEAAQLVGGSKVSLDKYVDPLVAEVLDMKDLAFGFLLNCKEPGLSEAVRGFF